MLARHGDAATEVAAEGLLEEPGTALGPIAAPFLEESLEVFADHSVETVD